MNPIEQYFADRDKQVRKNTGDRDIHMERDRFLDVIHRTNYIKNFSWMGIPIMQLPQDLMAMQEIIWQVQPDFIIETGVAFGGCTMFYASILEAIGHGIVVGIDIEIRDHNMKNLSRYRLRNRIELFEGSSIAPVLVLSVSKAVKDRKVIVVLDSNHTHDHVLQELKLYAPLVSLDSYIVVFDTLIEFLDQKYIVVRPWGKGNSPWSAVQEFMKGNDEFEVDRDIENRILLTSAPGGWLRRIKVAK